MRYLCNACIRTGIILGAIDLENQTPTEWERTRYKITGGQ